MFRSLIRKDLDDHHDVDDDDDVREDEDNDNADDDDVDDEIRQVQIYLNSFLFVFSESSLPPVFKFVLCFFFFLCYFRHCIILWPGLQVEFLFVVVSIATGTNIYYISC